MSKTSRNIARNRVTLRHHYVTLILRNIVNVGAHMTFNDVELRVRGRGEDERERTRRGREREREKREKRWKKRGEP